MRVDLSKMSAEDRAAYGRLDTHLRSRCGGNTLHSPRILIEPLADGSVMVTAAGERSVSPKRFVAFSSSASAPTLGEALCDAACGLGIDL